ncbi:MAG: hypothetical protein LBC97_05070 [Bifidobacteriaceae bacterium]|jgi:hypothetical protein|nr:hypothetical protein [Bifidobacteriaceae bacterium]
MTSTDAPNSVEAVDWSALKHAYGSAADVPEYLAAAMTDPEEVWELAGSILHQGSLYTATPVAMPFVARLALAPNCAGRIQALQVTSWFGQQVYEGVALTDTHSGQAGPAFDQRCRQAVRLCAAILAPLLNSVDPLLRGNAVHACQWLTEPDPAIAAALTEAFNVREWDISGDLAGADVHVAAFAGLARQGALAPELAAAGREDGDPRVRFVAAWSQVDAGGREPAVLHALAACWEAMAEDHVERSGPDPVVMISRIGDPLVVVEALGRGPVSAAVGALDVARTLFEEERIAPEAFVELALSVGLRPELALKNTAGTQLTQVGETQAAGEVWDTIDVPKKGKLDKDELSALVNLIQNGAAPARWLEPLLGHLESVPRPAVDRVEIGDGEVSLAFGLERAGTPMLPPLRDEALRQLRSARRKKGQSGGGLDWSRLISSWRR